jgi:hypothetical protein
MKKSFDFIHYYLLTKDALLTYLMQEILDC